MLCYSISHTEWYHITSAQQCGDNKLHNSRNKCSFTWFTVQAWHTWSISNEFSKLCIKFGLHFPNETFCFWISLHTCHLPLYLSCAHIYMHAHTSKSKTHTHFYLLVTRCQQEQVEGTLPHAEPSVCRCLSLSGTQHTNTTRLKETSSSAGTENITLAWRQITAKASDKEGVWGNRTTDSFAGFWYFLSFLFFFQEVWKNKCSFQAGTAFAFLQKTKKQMQI